MQAGEIRAFARRALRLGAYLTEEADRERLASYAEELEEHALQLENEAADIETMAEGRPTAE